MTTSPDQPRARRFAAFPFHPILVAAFPVLALWSAILKDVQTSDVLPILGLVVVLTAMLVVALGMVFASETLRSSSRRWHCSSSRTGTSGRASSIPPSV